MTGITRQKLYNLFNSATVKRKHSVLNVYREKDAYEP